MITKEKFQAYVKVQEAGATNMLDLRAVSALSGGVLTRADILEIRDSYNTYKEQYGGNETVSTDSLKPALDILKWLAQIEGTISIHGGVATTEDGMSVDLNQWRRINDLPA